MFDWEVFCKMLSLYFLFGWKNERLGAIINAPNLGKFLESIKPHFIPVWCAPVLAEFILHWFLLCGKWVTYYSFIYYIFNFVFVCF